jgi:hypothetical protein
LNHPLFTTLDYLSSRYPPSLSVKQVGEITSESVDTIRQALSRRRYPIPSFKVGSRRVFRLIDVAVYIDQQYAAANPLFTKGYNESLKSAPPTCRKAPGGRQHDDDR